MRLLFAFIFTSLASASVFAQSHCQFQFGPTIYTADFNNDRTVDVVFSDPDGLYPSGSYHFIYKGLKPTNPNFEIYKDHKEATLEVRRLDSQTLTLAMADMKMVDGVRQSVWFVVGGHCSQNGFYKIPTPKAHSEAITSNISVPNCLSSRDYPGEFHLEMNLTGRTAKDVFNFLAMTTIDPIWPKSQASTNDNHLNRAYDKIEIAVQPNMRRFPGGTSLEQTRPQVEAVIAKLMRLPGVSVRCEESGN